MKKTTILIMAFFVMHLSAQEKMEKEYPSDKSQVTTKEVAAIIGTDKLINEGYSSSIKAVVINANKDEEAEFDALMNSENEINKKALTAQVLNELLGNEKNDELSLLLVKNVSSCNMVLRVEGKANYNVPIPANGQNVIMVEKGFYKLKSKVCELKYEAQKDLNKNLLVAIKRMEY